jgi:UDP-N-acetylglucosamine 2-epimerase (non-hydrolysing)
MKIMTVVGTRPELIKLSCTIHLLDQHTKQVLVHTGQNYDYELNEIFFNELNIRKPDYFLEAAQLTAAETVGLIIAKIDELIIKEKPDAFLILGDTNSCMAAYAAKRRQIPIFHLEAGNRCFDLRVPEEINRKLIDHMSDINLVYTEHARRYLLQEGLPGEQIIKVGSPMQEIYNAHREGIQKSPILKNLNLKPQQFFVVSFHREENVDYEHHLQKILNTLIHIKNKYQMPVIVSTHPRTRNRLEALGFQFENSGIHFLKPLGFFDYVQLQQNAFCVISDSGTITEESSILDFPAITMRQAHERPEGMDEGTLIMTGLEEANILKSIEIVAQNKEKVTKKPMDYDVDFVSHKVLRIIFSYTDYINRVVWSKTPLNLEESVVQLCNR